MGGPSLYRCKTLKETSECKKKQAVIVIQKTTLKLIIWDEMTELYMQSSFAWIIELNSFYIISCCLFLVFFCCDRKAQNDCMKS